MFSIFYYSTARALYVADAEYTRAREMMMSKCLCLPMPQLLCAVCKDTLGRKTKNQPTR